MYGTHMNTLLKAQMLHVSHRITCVGLKHVILGFSQACTCVFILVVYTYKKSTIYALTKTCQHTESIEYRLTNSDPLYQLTIDVFHYSSYN